MASEISEKSQALVRALLEGLGMHVESIAEGDARTADFLVTDGTYRHLVEVTNREPGQDYRAFIGSLKQDGMAILTRGVRRQNRLDNAIIDKAGQLRGTPIEASFRIAWITALHDDDEHMMEELFNTLYGVARLNAVRDPNSIAEVSAPMSVDCYYYDPFSLQLETDLHAVGFASEGRAALFANPFADDAETFRRSRLAAAFVGIGRLVDPEDEVTRREALHMPLDVDRSLDGRHRALREKYGLFTQRPTESVQLMRIRIWPPLPSPKS